MYVFNDGCSSQYKSKVPFVHLTQLAEEFPSLKIERHFFFLAHHGKSLCDSCGGVVKTAAKRAVASGQVIQNAKQMINFCNKDLKMETTSKNYDHMLRSFRLISSKDVDRSLKSESLKTLKGSRKMHSMTPHNGQLKTKLLSCFCNICIQELPGCQHENFTGSWKAGKVEMIKTKNKRPFCRQRKKACSQRQKATRPDPAAQTPPAAQASAQSASNLPFSAMPDHAPSLEERKSFFESAQRSTESVNTFNELQGVCSTLTESLQQWKIEVLCHDPQVNIDCQAAQQLPGEMFRQYIPLSVLRDGNCFYRSLSVLVFGTEEMHIEMRVRITIDMVMKADLYTCKDYLSRVSESNNSILFLLTHFHQLISTVMSFLAPDCQRNL